MKSLATGTVTSQRQPDGTVTIQLSVKESDLERLARAGDSWCCFCHGSREKFVIKAGDGFTAAMKCSWHCKGPFALSPGECH